MLSQYKTIQKKINQEISNVKTQNMFQGNFSLMQSEVQKKIDLNQSLKQADKYGHKLKKQHLPNTANTTVVQSKKALNKPIQCAPADLSTEALGYDLKSVLAEANPDLFQSQPTTAPQQVPPPSNLNKPLPTTPPQQVPPPSNLNKPLPTTPPQQVPPAPNSIKTLATKAISIAADSKHQDKGAKTLDLGSSISSTIADAAKNVDPVAAGGTGGLLKLGTVATDARDARTSWQKGDKKGAGVSGLKATAGAAESGANMAKFAGDAVVGTGTVGGTIVGSVGGAGSLVSGTIDAGKGAHGIRKSRKGYHGIKGVARDAAEKIEPSQPDSKPRSTEELAQVQQMIPDKLQEQQQNMAANNQEIKAKKRELKQATDPKEKARLKGEIKSLQQANRPSSQKISDLKKQGDILQVAQYAAKTQSKTTKREGIHTASGVGQTVGGSLAIAGAPAGGIGAVPGAATSMAAASIKPIAYAARKSKQFGRDKGIRGFDPHKTSEKKDAERAEMAEKLAKRSNDPAMQTIFANLPGVSKDDTTRFSNDGVSPDEASQVLKRRHY